MVPHGIDAGYIISIYNNIDFNINLNINLNVDEN